MKWATACNWAARKLALPLLGTSVLLAVTSLSGCSYGLDRHGRPIDGWKRLTADTSPAPGPKPSVEVATEQIRSVLGARLSAIRIRSVHEVFYMGMLVPESGWLHCFTATGTNLFGQPASHDGGYVIFFKHDKWRVVTDVRPPRGTCFQ